MRGGPHARMLALALAPLAVAGDPLSAQRREQPAGVAAQAAARGRVPLTQRLDSAAAPTTLGQRYWVGLGLGVVAGLGAGLASDEGAASLAAYMAGTAGGVLLAGHAREGPRPVPVLLGTLVGATPIWLALADDRPSDGPDRRHLFLVIGLLTTPLGGAIAHELGR